MERGKSDVGSPLCSPYLLLLLWEACRAGRKQEGARCGCGQVGSRNSCPGITNEAKTVERSAEHSSPG